MKKAKHSVGHLAQPHLFKNSGNLYMVCVFACMYLEDSQETGNIAYIWGRKLEG